MKKSFALLLSLLCALCALAVDPPTMGWSSWNTFRVHISDSLICAQADAMRATGLQAAGYTYINIDDGFFGGRDATGRLLFHPTRFPRGLRPVVDHIHSLGFKAGIYSDAGRNTCGNFWDKDALGVGVGLYGHEAQDAALFFKELGFDFIKIDFCGGDAGQNAERLALSERERYTAIRAAIDATGRRDVRINICRWAFPGTWVSLVGSSWRIAGDISASWGAIKRIVARNRYLSAYAVGGAYNDMDMLEVGRGLTPAEERTHFGLWCIQSSPLLIGCDLRKLPPHTLSLITNPELIAVNQDRLGLQAYLVDQHDGVSLYVKDVNKLYGRERAVALYNATDREQHYTLRLSQLDLAGHTTVRDLAGRTDLAPTDGHITLTIPPHDTRLLRLKAAQRLERTRYEAETAWVNRYQELGKNPTQGYATYVDQASCSGGAKVSYLGNHPDNWMEWRGVHSQRGGKYVLTLHYLPHSSRPVTLWVNGAEVATCTLGATSNNNIAQATFAVTLKKGENAIRLGHATAWCPDVDCITLQRAQ